MTVKELKKLLRGVPDNLEVLVPLNGEFDGQFYTPCLAESGINGLGLYDEDEEKEMLLLNKPIIQDAFTLVPCGFSNITHEDEIRQLN